jgi:hypothetical protein
MHVFAKQELHNMRPNMPNSENSFLPEIGETHATRKDSSPEKDHQHRDDSERALRDTGEFGADADQATEQIARFASLHPSLDTWATLTGYYVD